MTKGQLTSSLSKLRDNLAFNSIRFPKITAYLTCSLVFKDVHGRSGGVCLVFQSHTLEQLGLSKDVRVTSDHGMFEEKLKKHLSNKMLAVYVFEHFESFRSIQFEFEKTGRTLIGVLRVRRHRIRQNITAYAAFTDPYSGEFGLEYLRSQERSLVTEVPIVIVIFLVENKVNLLDLGIVQ